MIIKIKVVERKPKFTKEKKRSPASQMKSDSFMIFTKFLFSD